MRVSLAGLTFCEVNLSGPKDKAEARVREVEEKEEPAEIEGEVGDCGVTAFLDWRRSCRAFARAFSCVRTKLARFWKVLNSHVSHLFVILTSL